MMCAKKQHVPRVICLLLFLMLMAAQGQVIELASPDESNQDIGRFGFTVKGLSDLTGDGIGELAVSTTETIDDIDQAGSVYILNGQDFSLVRRLVSPRPVFPSAFGFVLAEAPDLDGDKITEIIVTEQRVNKVYIFSGASGKVLQTLRSPENQEGIFGAAVVSLGTTRDNAVTTVAIGSPGCCDFNQPGNDARIHIFNPMTAKLISTIRKPGNKPWFGASLANIGDIDGDGRDDLAVGAGLEVEPYGPGGAYIVSGETGKVLHELIPPLPADITSSWALAAVPDVNADGKTDVLVGIGRGERAGAPTQSGHAYLFNGADGKLLRSLVSPGETESGGFGWYVAGVPDVTGDGAGELLVSAATSPLFPGFATWGERKMYLINGATGQTIQSFVSPYDSDNMGAGGNSAVLLGKNGRLRNLIVGVPRENERRGRVFAFSLRFLTAVRSDEGLRVSFTATDDKSYDLQASSDLKAWTTLTTLDATTQPVTFLDAVATGTNRRFYRAQQTRAPP